MGVEHVPELSGPMLDPASGSAQVGGPCMLTQREEGGPGLLAAEALVPCICSSLDFSASGSWLQRLIPVTVMTACDCCDSSRLSGRDSSRRGRDSSASESGANSRSQVFPTKDRTIHVLQHVSGINCTLALEKTWIAAAEPQSCGWVTAVTKPTRMSHRGNMPGRLQDRCPTRNPGQDVLSHNTKVRSKT